MMRELNPSRRIGAQVKPPPPPYEAAVYRQLWAVVAPFVQSQDLYSACLVSKLWHRVFSPILWANPAERFGRDSDTIYRKWQILLQYDLIAYLSHCNSSPRQKN